jgi:hypothetical protein
MSWAHSAQSSVVMAQEGLAQSLPDKSLQRLGGHNVLGRG